MESFDEYLSAKNIMHSILDRKYPKMSESDKIKFVDDFVDSSEPYSKYKKYYEPFKVEPRNWDVYGR